MNAAGHFVPAWYLKIAPAGFETFVPSRPAGGQASTRIPLTQDAWDSFYRTFPGKGMCATTPAHNTPEARAMMKTNGQKYCPCVTGVNLAGVRFGDDYSAQATEDELKKLHTKFVAIQHEKERRWQVEEFSMRDGIKKWANTEKQRVKREAMQG